MNISQVFDLLLKERSVTLPIDESINRESLRAALGRKLKTYKDSMGKIGYLDPEIESASLCVEVDNPNKQFTLMLKKRERVAVEYIIVQKAKSVEE